MALVILTAFAGAALTALPAVAVGFAVLGAFTCLTGTFVTGFVAFADLAGAFDGAEVFDLEGALAAGEGFGEAFDFAAGLVALAARFVATAGGSAFFRMSFEAALTGA